MSQDLIADALNMVLNAKKAKKEKIVVNRISNLLLEIMKIMKKEGAIKKYKVDSKNNSVEIFLGDFIYCRAIKPRFVFKKDTIEKYIRRYLPARDMGFVIVSTNQGLMTHYESIEKGIGGCLVSYFY